MKRSLDAVVVGPRLLYWCGHRPREGTHMPADVKGISAAKKVQREATQGGMRAALALEEIADHLEAMRSDALGYHNEVIAALKSLASR